MAGPGIPLNLDFYRPPSRPATPLTARGASGGYAPPILTMPPPSAATPSAPQSIATPMGSIPAHGPYARSAPSNAEPAFEFTVPSLPPRLANIGRKISQMSTDFMAEFDDGPPTRQSLERAQGQAQRAPSLGDTVPGMGDEPVMCPFCEKPLPPALLAGHAQGHGPGSKAANAAAAMKTTSSLAGPGLKRSNTTTAVQTRGSLRSEGARRAGLLDALPVEEGAAPRSSSVPAAKGGDKDTVVPVPTISAEEMRREEAEADGTNASSGKVVVSDADIRRWSRMAGIELPKAPAAAKTSGPSAETQLASAPVGGPTVPKLDPPPASGRPSASRASSSSSKFGFFGRKANPKKDLVVDDDSDEEGGQASGYSRLLAGGSDTESEGENDENGRARSRTRKEERQDKLEVLHDEPGRITPEEGADVDVGKAGSAAAPTAGDSPAEAVETSPEDLKDVLREVLAKLNEMSQSHTALHSSQTSLLTSLKIARSNLAMAEANTEMLEAQLKQQQKATASPASVSAPGSAQPRPSGVPATPMAQPRVVPASATIPGRSDIERQSQRPMSLQMPAGTSAPEKGGWGFWNNGKKKLQDAAQAFPANFPSPTMEKRSFDFEQYVAGSSAANGNGAAKSKDVSRLSSEGGSGMVRSASYSNLDAARSPPRTSSLAQNAAGSAATTAHAVELAKVRELYATAEKKIDAMSKELAELKKGKVEMEAELENLSQALFEEANKMVADERKKRAEVEESLKEVKEEREALKQTIKVLDGRGGVDDNASVKSVKSSRSISGADGSPAEEDLPDEFVPRDLDKHYEALRRSIHHVSDGAGETQGSGFLGALAVPETIPEDAVAGENSGADSRAEGSGQADDAEDREVLASSKSVTTVAPPLDPNPWANPSPFGTTETGDLEAKLPGEDQLRVRSSTEAPRSPVEDLDRLMERLQEDMKE